MSFLFVIFLNIIQSSGKSLILQSMFFQISFTYTRKSSCHKTLLCGTNEVTLTSLDSCPPTLLNSFTQTTTLVFTLEAANFISSRLWGAKLKTLENQLYSHLYLPTCTKVRCVLTHCDDLTFTRESRSKPMLSLA